MNKPDTFSPNPNVSQIACHKHPPHGNTTPCGCEPGECSCPPGTCPDGCCE